MLTIIIVLLALSAAYCGGMWLLMFVQTLRPAARAVIQADRDLRTEIQASTFHLGLCFILAAGFLGLILGGR